jgi:hypothetical protein
MDRHPPHPGPSRRRQRQHRHAGFEPLESRNLMTVVVQDIDVTEGLLFNGVIARFQGSDVTGPFASLTAAIDWGNGSTTAGQIAADPSGGLTVSGFTTYPENGLTTATVTVFGTNDSKATGVGPITVEATTPTLTGYAQTVAAGSPLNATLVTIRDANPLEVATNFTARITWETGQTTDATITANANGGFDVKGTHTYTTTGPRTATVVVFERGVADPVTTDVSITVTSNRSPVVTGVAVKALVGQAFDGVVATFTDAANPGALPSDYTATITWGDGTVDPSQGSIFATSGGFEVRSSHKFTAAGSYPVTIRVTRTADGVQAAASATASVTTLLVATPITFPAAAGSIFNGVVATFTDGVNTRPASDYTAKITWTDPPTAAGGTATTSDTVGLVISTPTGYEVRGTHTYSTNGTFPVTVVITRTADTAFATVTSQAQVVANQPTRPLTGRIEPGSDLGPSSTDGVTSVRRPVFSGAASPFAVVQLYLLRTATDGPTPIGQAVADSAGLWRTAVDPLPDGAYQIVATQALPGAAAGGLVTLQLVTIDTVAPRVVTVAYLRRSKTVQVVYADNLSGLADDSITTNSNYNFIGPPLRRVAAAKPVTTVASGAIKSDPTTVDVLLPPVAGPNTNAARPTSLRILSGGVIDQAGNPLNNGTPFQTRLAAHIRTRRLPGTGLGTTLAAKAALLRRLARS